MVKSVDREIEVIAERVRATLKIANKYDMHPRSKDRQDDVLGTHWYVFDLFKQGLSRRQIEEIFSRVNELGAHGKRFLTDVIDEAEREDIGPLFTTHQRLAATQLQLPLSDDRLYAMIRSVLYPS